MPLITATHVETVFDNTDAASYTSVSHSPTGNRLQLVAVGSALGSLPNIPTLTGNGATFAQVATVTNAGVVRLTYFRSLQASYTPGTVAIDFGGQTQSQCFYSFSEFDGIDLGGSNGSAAIIQSNTNITAGATSLTVTLGAFANPNNATVGGFYWDSGGVGTVGSGFTILGQASGERSGGTEWRNDNDTTVDMSWAGSLAALGIAIELGIATGLPVDTDFLMTFTVQR